MNQISPPSSMIETEIQCIKGHGTSKQRHFKSLTEILSGIRIDIICKFVDANKPEGYHQ